MITIDIADAFTKQWGYAPKLPTMPEAAARQETALLGGAYYANDSLGREMWMPVKLDGYVIPFAVVSINAKKTIVSTPMIERGGSVKELISIDDYQINIRALLINDDDRYPEKEVADIYYLFQQNKSLVLECVLTDIFLKGDFKQKVIVKDARFPGAAGFEHLQPVELQLESDMAFELEIV